MNAIQKSVSAPNLVSLNAEQLSVIEGLNTLVLFQPLEWYCTKKHDKKQHTISHIHFYTYKHQ